MERRTQTQTRAYGFVLGRRLPSNALRASDAYQRLQMARQNEQPPGSLRLARRQPSLTSTKSVTSTPPTQTHSNRVFEWVHTRVARFEE